MGLATYKHQAPIHRFKIYFRDVIESEALPTVVQLKRKNSYKPRLGSKPGMQAVA